MRTQIITIKERLDECWAKFDPEQFVKDDQIQIVKTVQEKHPDSIGDIEICAILITMVSWGQRSYIIPTAKKLMDNCDWNPLDFIKYGDFYDIPDEQQIYRTLKAKEFKKVCHLMRELYSRHGSIQNILHEKPTTTLDELLDSLCQLFEPAHLGSPKRYMACKRINTLLRWMVRKDKIDLGLWQTDNIKPADLYAIMDSQVSRQAIRLGLISFPKESWRAVLELTHVYRMWDPVDPLKNDLILMSNDITMWR